MGVFVCARAGACVHALEKEKKEIMYLFGSLWTGFFFLFCFFQISHMSNDRLVAELAS